MRLGGKGECKPVNVKIFSYVFVSPVDNTIGDLTGTEEFGSNVLITWKLSGQSGFYSANEENKSNRSGFFQPTRKIFQKGGKTIALPLLDIPELKDDPEIKLDIAGNKRPERAKSNGCFEPGRNSGPLTLWADKSNTGPDYLR